MVKRLKRPQPIFRPLIKEAHFKDRSFVVLYDSTILVFDFLVVKQEAHVFEGILKRTNGFAPVSRSQIVFKVGSSAESVGSF